MICFALQEFYPDSCSVNNMLAVLNNKKSHLYGQSYLNILSIII